MSPTKAAATVLSAWESGDGLQGPHKPGSKDAMLGAMLTDPNLRNRFFKILQTQQGWVRVYTFASDAHTRKFESAMYLEPRALKGLMKAWSSSCGGRRVLALEFSYNGGPRLEENLSLFTRIIKESVLIHLHANIKPDLGMILSKGFFRGLRTLKKKPTLQPVYGETADLLRRTVNVLLQIQNLAGRIAPGGGHELVEEATKIVNPRKPGYDELMRAMDRRMKTAAEHLGWPRREGEAVLEWLMGLNGIYNMGQWMRPGPHVQRELIFSRAQLKLSVMPHEFRGAHMFLLHWEGELKEEHVVPDRCMQDGARLAKDPEQRKECLRNLLKHPDLRRRFFKVLSTEKGWRMIMEWLQKSRDRTFEAELFSEPAVVRGLMKVWKASCSTRKPNNTADSGSDNATNNAGDSGSDNATNNAADGGSSTFTFLTDILSTKVCRYMLLKKNTDLVPIIAKPLIEGLRSVRKRNNPSLLHSVEAENFVEIMMMCLATINERKALEGESFPKKATFKKAMKWLGWTKGWQHDLVDWVLDLDNDNRRGTLMIYVIAGNHVDALTESCRKDVWSGVVASRCRTCGAVESFENAFKLCNRCKSVRYCSRECQRSDWKRHKVAECQEAD